MNLRPIDAMGFAGAALILFGFYRISSGKWTGKSHIYELDNLVGAGLLAAYHIITKTYPSLVLNIVWMAVAFRGLSSYAERKYGPRIKKRLRRKNG